MTEPAYVPPLAGGQVVSLCPACLIHSVERPGVTTVNGTIFCAEHGRDALMQQNDPILGGRGARMRQSAARPDGGWRPPTMPE